MLSLSVMCMKIYFLRVYRYLALLLFCVYCIAFHLDRLIYKNTGFSSYINIHMYTYIVHAVHSFCEGIEQVVHHRLTRVCESARILSLKCVSRIIIARARCVCTSSSLSRLLWYSCVQKRLRYVEPVCFDKCIAALFPWRAVTHDATIDAFVCRTHAGPSCMSHCSTRRGQGLRSYHRPDCVAS